MFPYEQQTKCRIKVKLIIQCFQHCFLLINFLSIRFVKNMCISHKHDRPLDKVFNTGVVDPILCPFCLSGLLHSSPKASTIFICNCCLLFQMHRSILPFETTFLYRTGKSLNVFKDLRFGQIFIQYFLSMLCYQLIIVETVLPCSNVA